MKKFFQVLFFSFSLLIAQAPSPVIASGKKIEIEASSVDLVWSSRSIDRYVGHLTLFAAGVVSMFQILECTTNPTNPCGWSTWLSVAAGIALFAGEIVNMATHKDVLKNLEYNRNELIDNREKCISGDAGNEILDKNVSDKVCDQFGAIIAQRDAYKSLLKGLKAQIWLRGAAAIAYGSAALIEGIAQAAGNGKKVAVKASAIALQAPVGTMAAVPATTAIATPCVAALAASIGSFVTTIVDFNTPMPEFSMTKTLRLRTTWRTGTYSLNGCKQVGIVEPVTAAATAENLALNTIGQAAELGSQPPPVGASTPENKILWYVKALNLLLNNAHAKTKSTTSVSSTFQQIGSGFHLTSFGVTTLIALVSKQRYAGNMLYDTPLKRAIWHAALGGIVGITIASTSAAIEEVNGHIASLNNLLVVAGTELAANNPGVSTPLGQGVQANFEDQSAIEYPELKKLGKLICPAGDSANGKCVNIPDKIYADLKELNLNDIAGVVSNIEDMSNELISPKGSVKTGLKLARELGGKAKKSLVKKATEQMKEYLKQSQKEAEVEPIDFDQAIEDTTKYALENTKELLKESGVDVRDIFEGAREELDEEEEKSEEKVPENKVAAKFEVPLPEVTKPKSFKFNLRKNNNTTSSSSNESDEDYSDIKAVHRRAGNIFQSITQRYQKTAYPRLLEMSYKGFNFSSHSRRF